ncbi:hypothetical protein HanRHA438_Chr10g0477251 [Helianthus annuus]|nr:hypothetical protein HanRHA438_Chr10g0477251 [Helianthus annuus]
MLCSIRTYAFCSMFCYFALDLEPGFLPEAVSPCSSLTSDLFILHYRCGFGVNCKFCPLSLGHFTSFVLYV